MKFGGRRSVTTMILAVAGAAVLTAVAGSGGVMAGTRTAAAPRAAALNGTWRTAREIPGTAAISKAFTQVNSVSCASAGNCSAGGWYTDSSDLVQPFVVSEVNGAWHNAVKVPGITTLNRGSDAVINSVSCGSAGGCSALGSYTDSSKHYQVFVVSKA